MHRSGHPGYDDDSQYPEDDDYQRCGGTGMVAYWDGSAYAGEMCRGCLDCEAPDRAAVCGCEIDRHDFNCPVHNDPDHPKRGPNGDE